MIRSAVVPAAPEDADPFKSEGAEDGLAVFAGGLLFFIIGFGPGTVQDGFASPFNEGLAKKGRGIPAPMDPDLLTTFFFDGSEASVLLEACSVRKATAIGAKSG